MRTFYEIHFTGEGFRTLGVYRLFFERALREARARREAYEAEVRDWYENGDGRPRSEGGKGFTFPTCIHGRDLWVDHDIPCGACEGEDGVISEAMGFARERFLRFNDRWDWANAAPGDLDPTTRRQLMEWAASLFPKKEA